MASIPFLGSNVYACLMMRGVPNRYGVIPEGAAKRFSRAKSTKRLSKGTDGVYFRVFKPRDFPHFHRSQIIGPAFSPGYPGLMIQESRALPAY